MLVVLWGIQERGEIGAIVGDQREGGNRRVCVYLCVYVGGWVFCCGPFRGENNKAKR